MPQRASLGLHQQGHSYKAPAVGGWQQRTKPLLCSCRLATHTSPSTLFKNPLDTTGISSLVSRQEVKTRLTNWKRTDILLSENSSHRFTRGGRFSYGIRSSTADMKQLTSCTANWLDLGHSFLSVIKAGLSPSGQAHQNQRPGEQAVP